MLLDETNGGGGHRGPWCPSCRQPILEGQRTIEVRFDVDPNGFRGYTGTYHVGCARPFTSMAHILNMDPSGGR
jgi:hypothetical protein